MATTYTDNGGGAPNGSDLEFTFTFPVLQTEDVKVALNGVTQATTKYAVDTASNPTKITFNNTSVDSSVQESSGAPKSGVLVRVYRQTTVGKASGDDDPKAVFAAGSSIRATDLNANSEQALYAIHELQDRPIETEDIQADAITNAKIADDQIDSEHYVDGSIDTQHIGDNQVTMAKLGSGALPTDITVADANIVTGTLDNRYYTETELNAGQLDNRYYTETELDAGQLDNRYFTETELTNGSLDGRYFTETELTNGALDGRYFTETESDARYFNISSGETIKDGDTFPDNDTTIATTAAINDRIIDLVDDVGGFVPIANETSFPTSNPDVNNGTGTIVSVSAASTNLTPSGTTVTISNGAGTGNTVTITGVSSTIPSGFGFLVETTGTLHTYTFHRLSPKATEVTTVAGKATEIGLLGTTAVVEDLSILGTADVVADLAILGTTDVVADLNTLGTADVVADLNTLGTADVVNDMNVLGTSANVTAMSTCATNISSINNASANISSANNFGDQYQVAANNPSTDGGGNTLAAGDLYFNTSANELKVYNGSSWQAGVTSTGNYALTTGNTFTGDNRYNDGVKALFGTGSDLEIFHSGNGSFIKDGGTGPLQLLTNKLHIRNVGNNEEGIIFSENGSVDLYYDNSKKLETTSTGIKISSGASGVDDILHLNSTGNSNGHGGKITFSRASHNRAEIEALKVETAHNETDIIFRTTKSGSLFEALRIVGDTGNIQIPADNKKLQLGASQDLEIFHSGNHSFIKDTGTGSLFTCTNSFNVNNAAATESIIIGNQNSSVKLFYDNVAKFETTSYGGIFGNDTSSAVASPVRLSLGGTHHSSAGGDPKLSIWTNGTEHMGFGVSGNQLDVILTQDDYDFVVYGGADGTTERFRVYGDSTGIKLPDSSKAYFGAGNDLQIYHVGGANSYIQNFANNLYLSSPNSVQIVTTETDSSAQEISGKFFRNDRVELYYDNVKKFETTSAGTQATGNLRVDGNVDLYDDNRLRCGDSADLLIYHEGNSFVRNMNAGAVLFLDTAGSKIQLAGDGTSSKTMANFFKDGAVELYYSGTKKFETASTGLYGHTFMPSSNGGYDLGANATRWRDIYVKDDGEIRCGDSNDLKIYHDGDHSYIKEEGTGSLIINSNTGVLATTDSFTVNNAANSENMIYAAANGGVNLYYDSSKKFEALSNGAIVYNRLFVENSNLKLEQGSGTSLRVQTAYGYGEMGPQNSSWNHFYTDRPKNYFNTHIAIDGNIEPYGTSGNYNLGSSSARWGNIYSMDLHLSNEGSSNDMDGTWGDWTIQEGESDLFLKNNRSGKKYKFNLLEVA